MLSAQEARKFAATPITEDNHIDHWCFVVETAARLGCSVYIPNRSKEINEELKAILVKKGYCISDPSDQTCFRVMA